MWTLADKYGVVTPLRAAEELVKKLSRFKPYIYRKATSRASIYIHFNGLPSLPLDHRSIPPNPHSSGSKSALPCSTVTGTS